MPSEQPGQTQVRVQIQATWPDLFAEEPAHRLSLRFYPRNGTPFERYLEGNVERGSVTVPAGAYTGVIALNESITDTAWWDGALTFTHPDDFDRFSAVATDTDLPLLASWSAAGLDLRADTSLYIELRPLACRLETQIDFSAQTEVRSFTATLAGLPARVSLASGTMEGTADRTFTTTSLRAFIPAAALSLRLTATLSDGRTCTWPDQSVLTTSASGGFHLRIPATGSLPEPTFANPTIPGTGVGIDPWPEQTIDL